MRHRMDALIGCAIGDCLGAPWENRGTPPPGWRATRFEYDFPYWTDDTQQSLVLLDVFLRRGRLDPKEVMDRFVQMRRDPNGGSLGLHRGTGRGFRHAVERYAESGRFEPMPGRAGNGAAMRVAPVAWAMEATPDARAQLVAVSSATHEPGIAVDAALAVAEAAWALKRGLRGKDALNTVGAELPPGQVRDVLDRVAHSVEPLDELEQASGRRAGDGYALCSPLAAIVIATTAPSLHAALREAVMLGGDTDSTAAMVGGLRAGADGLGDLPPELLDFPMSDRLRAWEKAPPSLEAWLDMERELCAIGHAL